tara:strand:- start:1102 stop:1269 length:168 start_codon:yes stop_codon:yes gene_type:complete
METALIVALVISSLVLIGFVISNIDWEEVKDQTMGLPADLEDLYFDLIPLNLDWL